MAVLDTFTVGSTDYDLQDTTARNGATNAWNKAIQVQDEEHYNRQAPPSFFLNNPETNSNNTYRESYPANAAFFWNSFNMSTTNASWYPQGMIMRTTRAVTAGTLINPGVNCEPYPLWYNFSNIKTYVGSDSKLHFTDAIGADSVLNFSGGSSGILTDTFENGATTQFTINGIENAYIFVFHQNNDAAGYRGGHKLFIKNGSNVTLVAQAGDYSRLGFSSATANSATFTYVPNGNDILGYYACKF